MFHLHQWEKTSEFKRPPALSSGVGKITINDERSAAAFGRLHRDTLVIVLRCKACGDHKIVEG